MHMGAEMKMKENVVVLPKYDDKEYQVRFERHFDELKWLYTEVYQNDEMFEELCEQIYTFYN